METRELLQRDAAGKLIARVGVPGAEQVEWLAGPRPFFQERPTPDDHVATASGLRRPVGSAGWLDRVGVEGSGWGMIVNGIYDHTVEFVTETTGRFQRA